MGHALSVWTNSHGPRCQSWREACCIYLSCVCFCSHWYFVSTVNGVKRKQKAVYAWSHCYMPKMYHTQGSSLLWCLCLHTWKGLLAATIVVIPALVGPNNYLRFTCLKLKSMKKLDVEKSIRKCIPHWEAPSFGPSSELNSYTNSSAELWVMRAFPRFLRPLSLHCCSQTSSLFDSLASRYRWPYLL